jgi:nucleolar pre-ribosomal-associated protein 1
MLNIHLEFPTCAASLELFHPCVSCIETFSSVTQITPQNFDILALTLSILANMLNLLSSHPDGHGPAVPLIKALFAPHLQRRFRGYLDGSQNDLILSTLKLFKALANFAGGREQKQVLENFPWTIKSLPKLLFMRRKGKGTETTNLLIRPGEYLQTPLCSAV